jgi:hypothetical protein
MNQLGPFVVLIGLAAVALSLLGALVARWNAEPRRIHRGLRKVLGETPHAVIVAPGRGRGAGFHFTSNTMAVAWDGGGWCLVYRIDELQGVELIVDGDVIARSWRGEARRALDCLRAAHDQVLLRLVFDDPHHPDFALELWSARDEGRARAFSATEAVDEGNRWIARTESVFRRNPAPPRSGPAEAAPAPARPPEPARVPPAARREAAEPERGPAAPARQELPFDAAPPWDDGDLGDEASEGTADDPADAPGPGELDAQAGGPAEPPPRRPASVEARFAVGRRSVPSRWMNRRP